MKPDGGMLSERERRILREIEREFEGSADPFLGGALSRSDPNRRLVVGAIFVTAGAVLAVATFTVSLVAATLALAAMGAGVGAGAVPASRLLRRRPHRSGGGGPEFHLSPERP